MKIICIFFFIFLCCRGTEQETGKGKNSQTNTISLSGLQWKFDIGDDLDYRKKDFPDHTWENADVPGAWEDWGFPGYDGYGWYRVKFTIPNPKEKVIYQIHLGRIDDVNSVFFNEQKMGQTGFFPPHYQTAFHEKRVYALPDFLIDYQNENTLAIRVYDDYSAGGILEGPLFIQEITISYDSLYTFDPVWKFSPGDQAEWASMTYNDEAWDEIKVPLYWEFQGYELLDGYAWYRKKIIVPKKWSSEDLVLLLGKIDDINEIFVNGQKIGSTGIFPGEDCPIENIFWQKDREYYISNDLLNGHEEFLIAVRVYDRIFNGGIYQGPIGLITASDYLKNKP